MLRQRRIDVREALPLPTPCPPVAYMPYTQHVHRLVADMMHPELQGPDPGTGLPLHSVCNTFVYMKTAQLPPVRVEPAVRAEIESALHEGESLSQFVELAVLQAARRRKAEQDFLARGRASLDNARKTGEFYPLRGVMDELQTRLEDRMKAHGRARRATADKP